MLHKKHKTETHQPTHRIEAFTDGVMAIIITIMVFDLRLPDFGKQLSPQDLYWAIVKLLPKLLSFAMSFLMVAIFWVNHHNFFHNLKHTDRSLLWYNIHMLFWLSLMPLPTAFIGNYPDSWLALMLFGGIMTMASTTFTLMIRYAMYRGQLMKDSISADIRRRLLRRSVIGPVLYCLSVPMALVSVYISIFIFFLVPAIYFMPYRILEEATSHE